MPNHLQTDKRSKRAKRRQTPRIIAAAADQTRHVLDSDPDRLAHSEGVARRAQFLRSIGWTERVCNLVAHHSGARFVAKLLDLDRQLARYRFTNDAVSDALTVADQTTGLHGEPVTVEQRISDMLKRHGPDSASAVAHPDREPYLRAAAARVTERLKRFGVYTEFTALAAAAH